MDENSVTAITFRAVIKHVLSFVFCVISDKQSPRGAQNTAYKVKEADESITLVKLDIISLLTSKFLYTSNCETRLQSQ